MRTAVEALLLGLLLGVCSTGCGADVFCTAEEPEQAYSEQKIIGGEPTADRRATVRVDTAQGFCSGTVMGPHTVMTAAHCVDELTLPSQIKIRSEVFPGLFGTWLVSHFAVHPEYMETRDYRDARIKRKAGDVAIIHTVTELPEPYARLWDGDECYPGLIAHGYGRTSDGEYQKLHERVVYQTHARRWFIYTTEGACFGDSGSSLYVQTVDASDVVVLGVTSRVAADDCQGRLFRARGGSVIYTNTNHYREWIEERIK